MTPPQWLHLEEMEVEKKIRKLQNDLQIIRDNMREYHKHTMACWNFQKTNTVSDNINCVCGPIKKYTKEESEDNTCDGFGDADQ